MDIIRAVKLAWRELKNERDNEVRAALSDIVREIIKQEFDKMPAEKRAEIIGATLKTQEVTAELLKKFVDSCPADKWVEVIFTTGESVRITGTMPERRGPGW